MIKTSATLVEKYDSPSGESCFLLFQPNEHFIFNEGQFMMIEATCWGKKIKKPYSIATTNKQLEETKKIGFYIKKASEEGLSAWLTQGISLGDEITLQGPIGHYTDSSTNANYLFISTGSGISPNLGIFQHLVYEKRLFNSIVFLYGERTTMDLIPNIQDLITQHLDDRVTTETYLSKESKEGYKEGYIQNGITDAISITSTSVSVFLCGSPSMVKETKQLLISMGIDKENITTENR